MGATPAPVTGDTLISVGNEQPDALGTDQAAGIPHGGVGHLKVTTCAGCSTASTASSHGVSGAESRSRRTPCGWCSTPAGSPRHRSARRAWATRLGGRWPRSPAGSLHAGWIPASPRAGEVNCVSKVRRWRSTAHSSRRPAAGSATTDPSAPRSALHRGRPGGSCRSSGRSGFHPPVPARGCCRSG